MQSVKDNLHQIIDSMSENEALELIEYVDFMRRKSQRSSFKGLEQASITSLDFWSNVRDDEAWNNV